MTCFSTLNINRAGASKVDLMASVMHDSDSPCDVLAVQEVDVDIPSSASFVNAMAKRGIKAFLGTSENGMYRTAVLSKLPGRVVQLEGVQSSRFTCVCFEFWQNGRYLKLLVGSFYGPASDKGASVDLVCDIIGRLRQSSFEWVLLGDFNVDLQDSAMAKVMANGLAWAWDDPFLVSSQLPATTKGGHRLDYALGSGRLAPSKVNHVWCGSDHALVQYETDLFAPRGCAMPCRPRLQTNEQISAKQWHETWDEPGFMNFLHTLQLDRAWGLLSDKAEQLLSVSHCSGLPRSASWKPAPAGQRSKAANGREGIALVQLRRLLRRLCQLRECPGDSHLRDKVASQVHKLSGRFEWLGELPYFDVELYCEWVERNLFELEASAKQAVFLKWRENMQESPANVRSWVKKRANLVGELGRSPPSLSAFENQQFECGILPVNVIRDAETEWMARWGQLTEASQCEDVNKLLADLPRFSEVSWECCFTAQALQKSARAMVGSAAGPDQWSVEAWLCLPEPFWEALAKLWTAVLHSGIVPERWREGRVVLLPKEVGFRPVTILSCAWRIGARVLAWSLRPWVASWAGHQTLGGIFRRGVKDAFVRITASLQDDFFYVQEDLSKFFDTIRLPHLLLTLDHLGAPRQFRELVASYYQNHRRVFSNAGVVGQQWHSITCGVAQGCPLSPLLAAVIMNVWSRVVEAGQASEVESLSFVDDRLFWTTSREAAVQAKRRSDLFDKAYLFRCEAAKCKVAFKSSCDFGHDLASSFNYVAGSSLSILGAIVELDPTATPTLKKFRLEVARRRMNLIAAACQSVNVKQLLMRTLVLPMATWAGGFARIEPPDLSALGHAHLMVLNRWNNVDTPPVVLHEVAGWSGHPQFAYWWAALTEAIRLHSCPPVWMAAAPVQLARLKWPDLLPVTKEVLHSLQWWEEQDGCFICRRDTRQQIRRFELGVDSCKVLEDWLMDWFRRDALNRCGRVVRSLHRPPEPHLAQGPELPGIARHSLCIFAGHVEAWRKASTGAERRAALVTGCSAWYKTRKIQAGQAAEMVCLCGLKCPSRPHLLWSCPATLVERNRIGVTAPVNRCEGRLLARVVPEFPLPPLVVDYDGYIDQLAALFQQRLTSSEHLIVATDGSVVDGVAAWAVVVDDAVCSLGVDAEDQTPHRAEVEALYAVYFALSRCSAHGTVDILSDCQAAMSVSNGLGETKVLAKRFLDLKQTMQHRIAVTSWWVPSHGKPAPSGWTAPPCGEAVARALNARADRVARRQASFIANGSLRQQCSQDRAVAFAWERRALQLLRSVSDRWAET